MHRFLCVAFLLPTLCGSLHAESLDFTDAWYSPIQVAYDFTENLLHHGLVLNEIDNEETTAIAAIEPVKIDSLRTHQKHILSRSDEAAAFIKSLLDME